MSTISFLCFGLFLTYLTATCITLTLSRRNVMSTRLFRWPGVDIRNSGGQSELVQAMSRNQADDGVINEGRRIEKLLITALKIAEGMSSSSMLSASNRTELMKISFNVRHKHKITLEEPFKAQMYLSLPVSNYSILTSKLVNRKDKKDVFQISIPIPSRTRNFDSNRGQVSLEASADVQVVPNPEEGMILMESGPVYLQMSNIYKRTDQELVVGGGHGDEILADDEEILRSILPLWLISRRDKDGIGDQEFVSSSVKSSIQAGFRVKLLWKPCSPADDKSFNGDNLHLTAFVDVHFDLGLPIRSDISRTVNFPPVNLLLTQAGRLIVKSVIKSVAPTLSDLLVKDYTSYQDGKRDCQRDNF